MRNNVPDTRQFLIYILFGIVFTLASCTNMRPGLPTGYEIKNGHVYYVRDSGQGHPGLSIADDIPDAEANTFQVFNQFGYMFKTSILHVKGL